MLRLITARSIATGLRAEARVTARRVMVPKLLQSRRRRIGKPACPRPREKDKVSAEMVAHMKRCRPEADFRCTSSTRRNSIDAAGGDRVLTERDLTELSRNNFLSARIKKATQRPKFAPGQLRARRVGH